MSYTYLQEQGEESSAVCFSDIPQFVLSRLNLTAEKSYFKDSEMESYQSSQSGTMCKPSMGNHGEEKLTSFAEDSHAPTLVVQEKEQESKASNLPCGNTWRELLVKFDLNTLSWKTHRCLWEEDLAPSSLTLPKWGMMLSGELLEHTMPVHPISAIEFGLLRKNAIGSQQTKLKADGFAEVANETFFLDADVTMENGSVSIVENGLIRFTMINGTVAHSVVPKMWLTPSANEDAAGTPNGNMQKMLGNHPLIRGQTQEEWNGGTLNPNWVEWLMGWVIGWTDLKPLEMDKFQQWLNLHGKY